MIKGVQSRHIMNNVPDRTLASLLDEFGTEGLTNRIMDISAAALKTPGQSEKLIKATMATEEEKLAEVRELSQHLNRS